MFDEPEAGDQPGATGQDGPQDIHRPPIAKPSGSSQSSPDPAPLSTGLPELPSTVEEDVEASNLASDALASARAIATGRSGGRPTGRFKRRRRTGEDGNLGGYSGARPDGRDPMLLGAIVGQSMAELGWVGPLAEARLLGNWASVVGSDIAGRCQPVSLTDGELKISAESTAWATQLRMMAPQILAKIGRELPPGTVRKLVISGPSAPSWKRGPWSMRGGRGVRDTYG
ncbi:MAG: DciA family protein [Jatrophihabitantaceae bacterium]